MLKRRPLPPSTHNISPRVLVLDQFICRDSGTTQAASLFLEIDGNPVDVILREALPVDGPVDLALRRALARVGAALADLSRQEIQ